MKTKGKKKKSNTRDYIASLTIYGAVKMGPEYRRDIAGWLRGQAKYLIKDGAEYSDKRFTARYMK